MIQRVFKSKSFKKGMHIPGKIFIFGIIVNIPLNGSLGDNWLSNNNLLDYTMFLCREMLAFSILYLLSK